MARAAQRAGVPVVNMRGTMADLPFPFIGSDNLAIAQLAAEHLLERGLQLLDACRRSQIAVPDQVAGLGVDNAEYLCDLSLFSPRMAVSPTVSPPAKKPMMPICLGSIPHSTA